MNFSFPLHFPRHDFSPFFLTVWPCDLLCYFNFSPSSSSNAQSRERKCLASEMYVLEMFSCDKSCPLIVYNFV